MAPIVVARRMKDFKLYGDSELHYITSGPSICLSHDRLLYPQPAATCCNLLQPAG